MRRLLLFTMQSGPAPARSKPQLLTLDDAFDMNNDKVAVILRIS